MRASRLTNLVVPVAAVVCFAAGFVGLWAFGREPFDAGAAEQSMRARLARVPSAMGVVSYEYADRDQPSLTRLVVYSDGAGQRRLDFERSDGTTSWYYSGTFIYECRHQLLSCYYFAPVPAGPPPPAEDLLPTFLPSVFAYVRRTTGHEAGVRATEQATFAGNAAECYELALPPRAGYEAGVCLTEDGFALSGWTSGRTGELSFGATSLVRAVRPEDFILPYPIVE
jgi:hypothetical protein